MPRPNNIFLVGPMGAGKSTIGRYVAQAMKMDFLDSDQEIEQRSGADIDWIYDVEGEEGLREREQRVIGDLTQGHGLVLATGGSAIISPDNRNCLAARGTVVYLFATVEQQLERTAYDRGRPILQQAENRQQCLEELMSFRDPLYREIADYVVETNNRTVRAVASNIVQLLTQED